MFFSKNFKKLTADNLPSNASEEDKAKCEYEPGSCLKYLTQLFAVFRTKGIVYSLLHDFSGAGGVQAYWVNLWQEIVDHRPELGRRPNKSEFEENEDEKMRFNAKPPFQPIDSAWDCMLVWYMRLTHQFAIQGCLEVSVAFVCCFVFVHVSHLVIRPPGCDALFPRNRDFDLDKR